MAVPKRWTWGHWVLSSVHPSVATLNKYPLSAFQYSKPLLLTCWDGEVGLICWCYKNSGFPLRTPFTIFGEGKLGENCLVGIQQVNPGRKTKLEWFLEAAEIIFIPRTLSYPVCPALVAFYDFWGVGGETRARETWTWILKFALGEFFQAGIAWALLSFTLLVWGLFQAVCVSVMYLPGLVLEVLLSKSGFTWTIWAYAGVTGKLEFSNLVLVTSKEGIERTQKNKGAGEFLTALCVNMENISFVLSWYPRGKILAD